MPADPARIVIRNLQATCFVGNLLLNYSKIRVETRTQHHCSNSHELILTLFYPSIPSTRVQPSRFSREIARNNCLSLTISRPTIRSILVFVQVQESDNNTKMSGLEKALFNLKVILFPPSALYNYRQLHKTHCVLP